MAVLNIGTFFLGHPVFHFDKRDFDSKDKDSGFGFVQVAKAITS